MIDLGIGTIQVKLSTGEVKTFDDVIAFGDSEQDDNFFKAIKFISDGVVQVWAVDEADLDEAKQIARA